MKFINMHNVSKCRIGGTRREVPGVNRLAGNKSLKVPVKTPVYLHVKRLTFADLLPSKSWQGRQLINRKYILLVE